MNDAVYTAVSRMIDKRDAANKPMLWLAISRELPDDVVIVTPTLFLLMNESEYHDFCRRVSSQGREMHEIT